MNSSPNQEIPIRNIILIAVIVTALAASTIFFHTYVPAKEPTQPTVVGHSFNLNTLEFERTPLNLPTVIVLPPEPPKPQPEPKKPKITAKTPTKKAVNVEQYRPIVSQYDWPVSVALAVMACESGGQATIVNDNPRTGDYSVGLMQINLYGSLRKKRPAESWLKVPENNIQYAYQIWSGSKRSFSAWSAYTNGCYRKYLI